MAPLGDCDRRPSHRVPALDGLRGVAILMVLWAHFGPDLLCGARGGIRPALHNLLGAGWAGVDLFFVLSGFLITGVLLDAKASGPNAAAYFGRFYARRALRIFPLYYLVLIGVAAYVALAGREQDVRAWREWAPWLSCYASNVFNARNGWRGGPGGLLLNHFWTLAVEEQFYLIWPVLVYACGRRALRGGCYGAIAFAVVLRFYCSAMDGNGYAATMLMPCRIDAFAVGGLLALAVRSGAMRARLDRAGAWMAAGAGLLVLPAFYRFQWMDVVGRTLLAVFFGGCILLALSAPLGRLLENRVLRVFGRYSYGLYVLHFLFYHAIDRCFPAARFGALGRFAGCATASLALAWCSWHLVEKHFLALKALKPLQIQTVGLSVVTP